MKVYGADFSGARNLRRGIYYAEGSLIDHTLTLERVVHCDDRLDLLTAIHFSNAPWGLDFSLSQQKLWSSSVSSSLNIL